MTVATLDASRDLFNPAEAIDVERTLRPKGFIDRPDVDFNAAEHLYSMEGEAVLMGVDRDGADAEFMRRPEHADRDLAAIGDEELGDGPHGLGGLLGRRGRGASGARTA